MPPAETSLARLIGRAAALIEGRSSRVVLGIAGPPGAGKTTLATEVAQALGPTAVVVGMDGFHLADAELRRLGRRDRKGATDTFDVDGYAVLLRRLRHPSDRVIYAPAYDRAVEEAVAAVVAVGPGVALVITEGNYLLVPQPPWDQIRPLLDEVWYCRLDDSERTTRLIDRHRRYGKSASDARRYVATVDDVNARLVETTAERADLIVERDRPG